jgi:predicted extracellular nuclease
MIKKHKEIRQRQTQRYLEEEQQQQKVLDNLQKLAYKRRKILTQVANSKSTINIYKINDNERSDLAMTLNKNMSLLKSSSKNTLSTHKLLKTQRKPKTKKIKPKVDSPSKLLSSDSELEEMSPREYLKY